MKLLLPLAGAMTLVGAAQAATVDFETFDTGAPINSVLFSDGTTATVQTDSNGSFDQAVAFNTNAFTGNDNDLVSPFPRASNNAETKNLGKVAVIEGPANDSLPNGSAGPTPDDEARGGTMTFVFDRLVEVLSFDYVDTEGNGNRLIATFRDEQGDAILSSGALIAGNGQFDTFDTVVAGVKSIDFDFGGSGALDNLTIAAVPLPAAMPLLLGALATFGVAARRRRKS